MHHADLPPPSLLHRLVPSSCFFFQRYGAHRDLHSFPTRRSSDLWTWRLAAAPLSPVTESAQTTRGRQPGCAEATGAPDRKSTRLNSSHITISYAVFCLKKKNKTNGVR